MNNVQKIRELEGLIHRWKAMAREYYWKKDFTNASLCRTLRMQAVEEINKLKGNV